MTSTTRLAEQREFYDRAYARTNYFNYRERLFRPYVRSLISLCGLAPGARVLDAGCGQGFFSYLMAREGMAVYGTDISVVGLSVARRMCAGTGAKFFAADLRQLPLAGQFDCVFVRSCSVFNAPEMGEGVSLVRHLTGHVKSGGVFLFVYNTNLSGVSQGWKHHSLADFKRFFERCALDVSLYLVNKADVVLLRNLAFSGLMTRVNALLSLRTGFGVEAVAVCRPGGNP